MLIAGLGLSIAAALSFYRPASRVNYITDEPVKVWFTGTSDLHLNVWGAGDVSFRGQQIEVESAMTVYDMSSRREIIGWGMVRDAQRQGIALYGHEQEATVWDDGQISGDIDLLTVLFQSDNQQTRAILTCDSADGLYAGLTGHSIGYYDGRIGYSIGIVHSPDYQAVVRTRFAEEAAILESVGLEIRSLGSQSPAQRLFDAGPDRFLLTIESSPPNLPCSVVVTSIDGRTMSWEVDEILVNGYNMTHRLPIYGDGPTMVVTASALRRGDGTIEDFGCNYHTQVADLVAKCEHGLMSVRREHFELGFIDTLEVANIAETEGLQMPAYAEFPASSGWTSHNLVFYSDPESGAKLSFNGTASNVRLNGDPLVETLWHGIPEFLRVSILASLTAVFTTLVKDAITKGGTK